MTNERDALLLASLELQLGAIGPLRARVERLTADLVAAPPLDWIGPARGAYNSASLALHSSASTACDAMNSAVGLIASASRIVAARE
ncbi:hypothetical protein M2152_002576 [Microbacteriaceae bacterium SG_E_30_P1]|uniref:Uncharacterized protein n=1 Tax=Antiquaquibacter oligotrophicus TaxID=2880260 RepID=A0ABT6KT84_9MICO|nr:hypothetical protein [Antiquaquibacter oligotrophicus]MDH6182394.1 hypothetical protein [Antiquaquibacter oligotrophicus]UDF14633.1 hypothetical protein LH407_07165 [Antiquaquibacter oligotrophicus]